jgi:hypothetical protein
MLCGLVAACNGGDVVIGGARVFGADAGEAGMFVPPPCWPCSADLRSVVACDGHVITQCPPGQACRPYPPDGGPARCEGNPCTSAAENMTSVGCDFYLVEPDASPSGAPTVNEGACWAALVANAWTEPLAMWFEQGNNPTSIDASTAAYIPIRTTNGIDYQPLSVYGDLLPPNKMAVVFISSDTGSPQCPKDPRFSNGDFAVQGTGRRNALRLRTTQPAAIYDVYPYGGAAASVPSATLLLPTSTWGTSSLGVTAWPVPNVAMANVAAPGLAIVALGTTVSITSPVAIAAGPGVLPAAKLVPARYPIDPGEELQLQQPDDLSGSLLTLAAGAPFSVWGVHKCMSIQGGSCDGGHLQLPPSQALGSQFVGARFPTRTAGEESVPWRFVALADATLLQFDPPTVQSPVLLNAGQSWQISAPGPFSVSSQNLSHPFFATEHMTHDQGLPAEGDPETVGLVPVEQWLSSYTFAVEPTYGHTNIVIVQARNGPSFQDVTLDCLTAPLSAWQPVGSQGKYQFTRVELQKDGQAIGNCDFGLHSVASRGPFTVTVWGMDDSVSYAYPAGAGVRKINTVNVINPPK